MTTSTDRVIEAVRRSRGLDDGELVREAAVDPGVVSRANPCGMSNDKKSGMSMW